MAEASDPKDLSALRVRIDALDLELLALLNRRADLALHVGEVKRATGAAVFRPEREAQVIAGLQAANAGPIKGDSIAAIWREIMSACRSLEEPTRVAFLGPAGTFSEEAAQTYFGSSFAGVACGSIDEVFRSTGAGAAEFGVVPIENSTEGVVTRSLDLLLTSKLSIVAELSLRVQHNLLRKIEGTDGIKVICAHPQALAQCQGWLGQHMPDVERRAVSSNAEGARLAAADPTVAAIASLRAAGHWGLHLLGRAIQDDVHNRTRFAVVADATRHPTPKASGRDCTSLVASVANKPGAVHDMLTPLKTHGVSMSRLESRPARSGEWEYYFYIDLDGHPDQPHVARAIDELRQTCAFLRVLGTYPVGAA